MPNINLPLDDTLLNLTDRARGDIPRVVFIRRALEEKLNLRVKDRTPRPTPVRSSAQARANARAIPKGAAKK